MGTVNFPDGASTRLNPRAVDTSLVITVKVGGRWKMGGRIARGEETVALAEAGQPCSRHEDATVIEVGV